MQRKTITNTPWGALLSLEREDYFLAVFLVLWVISSIYQFFLLDFS